MSEPTLESIYAQHRRALLALAVLITDDVAAAEDAVHDAFERLCRTGIAHADDPTAYAFAAVRHAAIDQARRRRPGQQTGELGCSIFQDPSPGPMHELLSAERDRLLSESIDALPAEIREAVVLRVYAGLSFAQIAQVIGCPLPTAATRYRRALGRLRQQLEKLV